MDSRWWLAAADWPFVHSESVSAREGVCSASADPHSETLTWTAPPDVERNKITVKMLLLLP